MYGLYALTGAGRQPTIYSKKQVYAGNIQVYGGLIHCLPAANGLSRAVKQLLQGRIQLYSRLQQLIPRSQQLLRTPM
jgi:succinyl-CoA synthetase beta subunit